MKIILLILAGICFSLNLFSQVTVEIIPPPPNELNMETFNTSIVLTNEQPEPVPVMLIVTVDEANDGRIVDGTTSVFEAGQGMTYASEEIIEMFRATYHPAYESGFIRSGNAPSGNYTVCVQVIHAETEMELDRKCIRQEVALPHPPVLIFPPEGEPIMEDVPVFTWTPPVPIAATAEVMYKIVVNEILDFQTPEEALKSSPVWFTEDEIYETSFVYPLAAREFEPDKTYVWAVQSLSPDGFPMGENNGWSEVHTFSSMPDNEIDLSLVNLSIPKIELIYPEPGAEVSAEGTQFCWKKLPRDDVRYTVISRHRLCAEEVSSDSKNHPFSELIPAELGLKLDSLRKDTTRIGANIRYLDRLCNSIKENERKAERNIKQYNILKNDYQSIANRIKEERNFELKEDCPDHISCCDKFNCDTLDPCNIAHQQKYYEKLNCFIDFQFYYRKMQLNASSDLPRLFERWNNGSDHRATMEAYDAYFSIAGDIIGFLPSLIDKLSQSALDIVIGEVKSIIEDAVKNKMLDQLSPQVRSRIDSLRNSAATATDAYNAIKDIVMAAKTGGEFPPTLIMKMMETMYQSAQQATGTAIQGWDNFANTMVGKLQKAYVATNCLISLSECQKTAFINCENFCEQMKQCAINDFQQKVRQINAVHKQAEEDGIMRTEYWDDARQKIKTKVENALSFVPYDKVKECCISDSGIMNVPGSSECEKMLESILAEALGEAICYLTFKFSCTGDSDNVQFDYTHSFPSLLPREGCCLDSLITESELGSTDSDRNCIPVNQSGRVGGIVVPGIGRTSEWRVEAHDSDGNLVGESLNRAIQSHRTVPATPSTLISLPDTTVHSCDCKINVDVNGKGFQASSTFAVNSNVNFKLVTECGKKCNEVLTSLTINHIKGNRFPVQPVVFTQKTSTYKFIESGMYSLVATLVCNDGSTCEKDFEIIIKDLELPVKPPKGSVGLFDMTEPSCGNALCMHVFWSDNQTNNPEQITFNNIEFNQPVELDLQLQSDCFNTGCDKQTDILWEIRRPDGRVDKPQGTDLYDITYNFDQQGVFLICIYQTGSCNGQKITYTKYIKVIIN